MNALKYTDWCNMNVHSGGDWIDRFAIMLFQWLDGPRIRQTAGEVARECHLAVWEDTLAETRQMTSAQARGYIRAVAAGFAARETDPAMSRRRLSATLRPQVMAEATEQLIGLLMNDLSRVRSYPAWGIRAKAA